MSPVGNHFDRAHAVAKLGDANAVAVCDDMAVGGDGVFIDDDTATNPVAAVVGQCMHFDYRGFEVVNQIQVGLGMCRLCQQAVSYQCKDVGQ